ncbi:MAG: type II toxin-antitoxin system prevent-host-death family antitoxin [Oscillospiraceae bacterium]|nr:type II toxin-antitoxin system prevent-host-death family antitoxin [Oscillospiraceae bacterium]
MPTIRPISDLRSYAAVLGEVAANRPVFLTKNGRGKFAIIDINEYEDLRIVKGFGQLAAELEKGRRSGEEHGWLTEDEVWKDLDVE